MIMRMLMGVIMPVLVGMRMHCASRRQIIRSMGMRAFEMIGVIMPTPKMLGTIIGDQETLAMVPAITEDIVIFLTFGGTLILAQAEPFTMGMLFDAFSDHRQGHDTIAGGFEEKAV